MLSHVTQVGHMMAVPESRQKGAASGYLLHQPRRLLSVTHWLGSPGSNAVRLTNAPEMELALPCAHGSGHRSESWLRPPRPPPAGCSTPLHWGWGVGSTAQGRANHCTSRARVRPGSCLTSAHFPLAKAKHVSSLVRPSTCFNPMG